MAPRNGSVALAIAVCVLVAFCVASCGGSSSTLSKAYGGLSAQDQSGFKQVLRDLRLVSLDYIPMFDQLKSNDQAASMQSKMDAFTNEVNVGAEDAAGINNNRLRTSATKLFAAFFKVGTVASRIVIADGDPNTSDSEGQQLVNDFGNAVIGERTAYLSFIQGVAEYMTPAQRRALKQSEQQYQTKLENSGG